MQKSRLKSTTSLVMSFSLIASPILAQQAAVEGALPELCIGLGPTAMADADTEVVLPCLAVDGTLIVDQDALDAALEAQADAAGEMEQDEAAATAETAAEADAVTEEPGDTVVETEDAATDAPETAAGDEAAVEADATVEAEVDAAEDVVVETDSDTAATEDTTEEMADAPSTESEAETDSADIEVPVTDGALENDGDTAAATEEATESDDADVTVSEGLPEGDDTDVVITEGLPEGDGTDVVVTEGAPEGATEEEATEEEVTTIVDDTPPAAAAAAEADDSDTDTAPTGDVVVEELSTEDVRASDQDFQTSATGNTEAAASRDDDDDSGLSNFEKALLVGLGAVVVGSVLNNGDEVVSNSGDRVVVRRDDELVVLKDDDVLLRQPGSQVQTESFADGSTRTIVTRQDGTQIKTIRASDGRVLRRTRVFEDGSELVLFDDTQLSDPIDMTQLPEVRQDRVQMNASQNDVESLRLALLATQNAGIDRTFSLRQIRQIEEVRALAPEIELDTVTFATASAAIDPSQAEELTSLGVAMSNIIEEDPSQVFLIEGHTDAVGDAGYNLALSDRRAETVALALTEYFDIPPENLITQGYGESALKIQTLEAERANRRASVRNITSLLR